LATCRTCGLSMSDSVTFCSVCGTPAITDSPVAASSDAVPPEEVHDEPATYDMSDLPYNYRPDPGGYPATPTVAGGGAASAARSQATSMAAVTAALQTRNGRVIAGGAIGLVILWAVLMVVTGRGLGVVELVATLVSYAVMAACLYVAAMVMGFALSLRRMLAIAFVCAMTGAILGLIMGAALGVAGPGGVLLFPLSLFVTLGAYVVIIKAFTDAEWLDAMAIVFIYIVLSYVVNFMIWSLFGLALLHAMTQ
jgi:hypothetical protein